MLSVVTYLTLAALLTRLDTRRSVKHDFMSVGILLTLWVQANEQRGRRFRFLQDS
jgi:hypothetical protein